MNGWFNPDNALDLISQLLLIIGGLAIAVTPSVIAARSHKSIARVENSVSNGHSVPLRQDLDKAILAIEALAHDVHGLRKDLAMEEDRRRVQIQDLATDVDRMRRR
jgi:hypothetical protein